MKDTPLGRFYNDRSVLILGFDDNLATVTETMFINDVAV